jgi:acyl carrier protein
VIVKCISLLKGKGRIIIGDVRDNRLLELFKGRLHLNKFQHSVSIKEFMWAVQQDVLKEEELCFSPDYFYRLQSLHPEISHVDIQWKHASYTNELSLYRYTVVIYVGTEGEVIEPKWQKWQEETGKHIVDQLQQEIATIALKDVPNPRLKTERQLTKALKDKTVNSVSDILAFIEKEDKESLEIEDMLAVAQAKGYHYKLLMHEDPLNVNLLLELNPSNGFIKQPYLKNELNKIDYFTNTPLFNDISLLLLKDIRSLLQKRLPDYMVPAEMVALSQLPLTTNGKVDRLFLSLREDRGGVKHLNYQPPASEVDKILVNIWQELLGVDRIGIYDNFFEIGGHSLLAIRVISAIRDKWEVELLAKDIFEYPTINELSKYLEIQLNIYSLEDDSSEFEIVTL